MTDFVIFKDKAGPEHLGLWPAIFLDDDPRPAREQVNERYSYGGGWMPMRGFTMTETMDLCYPGDPALPAFAACRLPLSKETVYFYPHAQVAIVQDDGKFEAGRMD